MKIRTSILAKGLAWILIAISGMGLLGSGFLAIGMEQSEFYDRTYEEIREERFETFHHSPRLTVTPNATPSL